MFSRNVIANGENKGGKNMTINELKRILAKEKVYKYDYAFSKAEGGFIDVVFYLFFWRT